MFTLANAQLSVELIDPAADRARLGPRFCWGGYIWQVHDRKAGPLLAGPEWPNPNPTAFNGQGLPESFRHRRRDGQPITWAGNRGLAFGVGELQDASDGACTVTAPCSWQITETATSVRFQTEQELAGFSASLVRTVALVERTLHSHTCLTNRAAVPVALQWFVHPFFALVDGLVSAELPQDAALAENPGFALSQGRLTQQRRFRHEKDGAFEALQFAQPAPLVAQFRHPGLSHVRFATSFAPSEVVIWGNSNTFSIEPYLDFTLRPGESRTWSLRYDFGEPAA